MAAVGFYSRNVTELILFGVKGKNARTLAPGRRQVNYLSTRKREHSRKPDEQYQIIEACSRGPYLELFARGVRSGWVSWGNQAEETYRPTWKTYAHHSRAAVSPAEWSNPPGTSSSRISLSAAWPPSKVTVVAGRPISTKGQGFPTPRCTRSTSFRQCVVDSANLSDTNLSTNTSTKASRLLTRSSMIRRCVIVGLYPQIFKSGNDLMFRSSRKRRANEDIFS